MKRKVGATVAIAVALGVILGIGAFLPLPGTDPRLTEIVGGPVYTVPQVQQGIARHPTAWVGRIIRLRAVLIGAPGEILPPGTPMWGFVAFPTVDLGLSLPAESVPVDIGHHTLLQWLKIAPPPEPPADAHPQITGTAQIYTVHLVVKQLVGYGKEPQRVFAVFDLPVAFEG